MYGRKNTRQSRTNRNPGQGSRAKQQAIASGSPIKTIITRALGLPSMEQAWGKGADGEEHVGELLNQLQPLGWTVIHDLKISSSGANVDHLVIGPPGVFVIDTKFVSGNVWVGGSNVMVGGFSKDYVEKLEAQAMRVREKLCNATGWGSLWVQGLLVFVEPNLTVKEQPNNVVVLSDDELVPGLLQQPPKLSPRQMEMLSQVAMSGNTWI
ncbi:NERD domain-containing protein [Archangium violaceum]|uniref:nuclease-related domain-containing protein n=1 Tax=Archangium violaceum TaxID=83451 RepID=UPI00194E2B14|nr:nuclease-related domain-containing protein [Archangium violaceum]QRN96845.1 NERD domain-containing protein [Archangium violaceum]